MLMKYLNDPLQLENFKIFKINIGILFISGMKRKVFLNNLLMVIYECQTLITLMNVCGGVSPLLPMMMEMSITTNSLQGLRQSALL